MWGGGCRYYEWLKKGKERVPYFTRFRDGRVMLLAGLWDVAHIDGTPRFPACLVVDGSLTSACVMVGREKPLYTFTIVTTSSSLSCVKS